MFRRNLQQVAAATTGFNSRRTISFAPVFGTPFSPFLKGAAVFVTGAVSYAVYDPDTVHAFSLFKKKEADPAKTDRPSSDVTRTIAEGAHYANPQTLMTPHPMYRDYPVEKAKLTVAPNVPPPIERNYPVVLRADMSYDSFVGQLTRRFKFDYWGFNGSCPGPFIRAREGDVLEVNVVNNDPSGMPHNIDFHACDGPGGGAPLLLAAQGETKSAQFLLSHPGLYVYHCAAAPVPMHIANGMYGMILVEPREGLRKVDKEFYVMQSEFYVDESAVDERGVVPINYAKGLAEQPDYIVFNGKEGSLTDRNPLKANVGDDVRIFFGNAGPNLHSAFHMIGAIFDRCYPNGDTLSSPMRNVQTTSVPPGGATVVEFKCAVPGSLTLVDHAIFRLDKGAVGYLMVSGDPQPQLYNSTQHPTPCPGCKLHP